MKQTILMQYSRNQTYSYS